MHLTQKNHNDNFAIIPVVTETLPKTVMAAYHYKMYTEYEFLFLFSPNLERANGRPRNLKHRDNR